MKRKVHTWEFQILKFQLFRNIVSNWVWTKMSRVLVRDIAGGKSWCNDLRWYFPKKWWEVGEGKWIRSWTLRKRQSGWAARRLRVRELEERKWWQWRSEQRVAKGAVLVNNVKCLKLIWGPESCHWIWQLERWPVLVSIGDFVRAVSAEKPDWRGLKSEWKVRKCRLLCIYRCLWSNALGFPCSFPMHKFHNDTLHNFLKCNYIKPFLFPFLCEYKHLKSTI